MGTVSLIWVLVSLGLSAVVIVVLINASAKKSARDAARWAYFAARYDGSVDRMLAEAPLDHEQLRAIRDGGRSGPVKAARLLLLAEPIPLAVAAEFIKQV